MAPDANGVLVGAISVTGPANRMTERKIQAIVPELTASAKEISRRLGNRCL